jgi:exonuclease SbcD
VHPKPSLPEAGAVATYATAAGWDLRLAALPFVHANRVLTDFAALSEPNATYNDSLRRIIGHLTRVCLTGFDPTRQLAVFASHLHIAGARTSSEREIHIATGYATDAAHLDPAYGYLAFGHIHVPQVVAGGRGRYAGSMLEVDFGEEGEAKQVGIVDLEPGRPTAINSVPLVAPRRLRRLRTSLSALAERAAELRGDLAEVTIGPEPGAGPVDRDAPIWVAEQRYDTLSHAVRELLPDVTVVGVVDARNPVAALADEVAAPDAIESVDEAFAAWLAGGGAGLLAKNPFASADRVAELFAELRGAGAADADGPALAEVVALQGVLGS